MCALKIHYPLGGENHTFMKPVRFSTDLKGFSIPIKHTWIVYVYKVLQSPLADIALKFSRGSDYFD